MAPLEGTTMTFLALILAQGPNGQPVPEPAGGLSNIFSGVPWIDVLGLVIVSVFLILGVRHGLVWQVTRLIGMLIAVTIARSVSPEFVPQVEAALALPTRACQGIVWFLVFSATLIVTAMIGMVGRRALEAVHLGPMDRMGGGVAGAVTGVIVHCALLVLLTSVGSTSWASKTFRGSASASMLDSLSRKSHLLLDAQAAERIMEPWGQSYDAQQALELQREMELDRQRSLSKAAELKAQYEEELQRANRDAQPESRPYAVR